ncbi:hypothetical protein OL599_12535 [Rhodovastum sp. RN2-1]|uniref:Uncharacterized protein n=1 Tax=Limobrevibacterium gyesilva TaxID=2991712 RepID=A0AA41YN44_9PROT|nr:hypothetical protein [Limobrevibacterium gyesilva]
MSRSIALMFALAIAAVLAAALAPSATRPIFSSAPGMHIQAA